MLSESTAKYASNGDGAAWTSTKTRPNASAGWTTTWTRNIGDLGGGLGILQSSDGTARLQLSDLRGNVVGSATIGSTAIDSYASYTEYGLARTEIPAEYEGYGWLGRHARKSAGNVGGVTLMGARLYNPTTGRFLSRDSVQGGNDNAYVYPPDPINKLDLDGKSWLSGLIIKLIVKIVAAVVRQVVAGASKMAKAIKQPKKTTINKKTSKSFKGSGGSSSFEPYTAAEKRNIAEAEAFMKKFKEDWRSPNFSCFMGSVSSAGGVVTTVGSLGGPPVLLVIGAAAFVTGLASVVSGC